MGQPLKLSAKKVYNELKRGLSKSEVARNNGVTPAAITYHTKFFNQLTENKEEIKKFDDNEDLMLSGAKRIFLLDALKPEKLKKMSSYQAIGSYSLLFDKQRLKQDKSTHNFSVRSVAMGIAEEIERLKAAQNLISNEPQVDAMPVIDVDK